MVVTPDAAPTSAPGALLARNAKRLSGSSAIPVPNASSANPNQIQFTSGFTVTWNVADWSLMSYAASTTYTSSLSRRRIATSVVGSASYLR